MRRRILADAAREEEGAMVCMGDWVWAREFSQINLCFVPKTLLFHGLPKEFVWKCPSFIPAGRLVCDSSYCGRSSLSNGELSVRKTISDGVPATT